jgi:hypothetical protein
MALHGSMPDSAARHLRPAEAAQAMIGGQSASARASGLGGPTVTVRYNAPSPMG